MPTQPVISIQSEVWPKASEEEQRRLERLKKYDPPTFSGTITEDEYGFLEKCHRILRTMGIVEVSGIAFTIFQLSGAAYRWWQAYENGRRASATPLNWAQFLDIFLREFVSQTLQDAWHIEFKQLCQGTMLVSEYAIRFSELSQHAPALVSTVKERVRRFIEGLNYGIRFSMARELETDAPFQQVVEIARRFEGMQGHVTEDMEAKRSRDSGGYSGACALVAAHHGRGYVSHPVHSALPASM
ncbi:uncharacterized protein [Nicotiana tomentosiformis]|uniref:uncharacterized protein n=1 Tax=Nicotiana tomentosiformis TaxID=4098 RepID=UPI00388CC506